MRRPLGAAALGRRGGSPAAAALGMTPIQHDVDALHAAAALAQVVIEVGTAASDDEHQSIVSGSIRYRVPGQHRPPPHRDLDPIGTRDEDPGVINSDFGAGGRPRGQRPGGRGSSGRDAGATARHSHRATVTSPDP